MQTSTIRYRVADFLKQFPPFHFLEPDDLLELAGAGRVRFHEGDESIFEQEGERKPFIWVIRQGAVRLYDETDGSLRDMLGAGELLGIGRFVGAPKYLYTAKTAGDVLLYAFPAVAFEKIVSKYKAVQRYLEAYFTVRPEAEGESSDRVQRFGDPRALSGLAAQRLLTCRPETTVREAAGVMRERDAEAIVVADASGRPLGVLSWRRLRDRLAEGALAPDQACGEAASSAIKTAPAGLSMEDYQLEMMGSPDGRLILTADGGASSPATGVLSAADLSLLLGVNPALLAQEAARAERPADLAPLVVRTKALVARALSDHRRAEWAAHVAGELNAMIVRRLVTLAERDLAELEPGFPSFRRCWLLLGGAGRRELVTWVDLDVAAVREDLPEEEAIAADLWLSKVGERLDAGLQACGFRFTEAAARATSGGLRQPLGEWRRRFDGWITAPIENNIYAARSFFDFRPAAGDKRLARELRAHVLDRVGRNPGFLRLLANDCLANLPPLTFFQGLVVEDGGVRREKLDIRRAAVFPLMDTARVFGLRCGETEPGTFERFAAAARNEPGHASLFAAAQEAYRITLAHRGRRGLAAGDDGSLFEPSELSKVDQQILKGAFRTIVDLLRYTAEVFEIEGGE